MIMIISVVCHSSTVIILRVSRAGVITVTNAEWVTWRAQLCFGMTFMYINEPVSRIHCNNINIIFNFNIYINKRVAWLHAQLSHRHLTCE